MPFGKTKEQILAEMFPGKTEAQITEMVSSFDTIKAKADKVAALETTVATTNTELANVRVKLQELEAGGNKPTPPGNNTTERPDWGEDADAAFQDRSKPLVGLTLETRAEMIYDRVVNKLEREDPHFPVLRKEFDEMLKAEKNPASRANQAYVENCYAVVYSRHRFDIQRDQNAKSGVYFVESGRNQNNTNLDNNNRPDTTKTLTEEEKREARKFGLTDEKWLETRNKIKFVGGALQNM